MMREHEINETEVDLKRSPSLGDGRKGCQNAEAVDAKREAGGHPSESIYATGFTVRWMVHSETRL
jgi:hypothetical protein